MKRTLLGLFILCALGFTAWIYQREYTFDPAKIQTRAPYDARWDFGPPDDEKLATLQNMFEGPLLYLGRGAQCYAFVSRDGAYVLKLFKQHHLTPEHWLERVPFSFVQSYCQRKVANRTQRRELLFNSCKLAYEELPDETGIFYLHLNPTPGLFEKTIEIRDRFGELHRLNIDHYQFVVQERATPARAWITARIQEGNQDRAIWGVEQTLEMIARRCSKGISDQDPAFLQNYGFSRRGPIHLDLGRFEPYPLIKERPFFDAEIQRTTQQLREWVAEKHPELLPSFEEKLQEVLNRQKVTEVPDDQDRYCSS